MAFLFDTGIFSAVGSDGSALAGAKLTFYENRTTDLKDTFATNELNPLSANQNPVEADGNGRWGPIWLDDTLYTVKLQPADNSFNRTRDDIGSPIIAAGYSHAVDYPSGTIGDHLKHFVLVTDAPFNAKGDGATDDAPAFQAAIDFLAANGGGFLYVPAAPVAYKWLTPVKYVGTDPIAIVGLGPVSGTAIGNVGNIPLINWAGDTDEEVLCAETSSTDGSVALSGFYVSNLMFTTPIQAKASGGVGLALRGVYPFGIDNVTITGFATGFLTDDNPAASGVHSVRCGKGSVRDLRVASAAYRRVSLRGTCDSRFYGLECLEETVAAYDCDLYIDAGTNGGRTDSLSFHASAFVANGLSGSNRPDSNVYITGEDTLFINFTDCAFEISKSASVRILLPTLADPEYRTATLTNCWWNSHEGYCGDFQRSHVDVINPRGSCFGSASAFRFVGDPADATSPRLGGSVTGGLVNYAGAAGVEVHAAASVGIIGVQGNRTGGTGPVVRLNGNASECLVVGTRPSSGVVAVQDNGTSNTNTIIDQSQIKMPIASIGDFADDAAAISGGYTTGRFYRTGSDVKVVAS